MVVILDALVGEVAVVVSLGGVVFNLPDMEITRLIFRISLIVGLDFLVDSLVVVAVVVILSVVELVVLVAPLVVIFVAVAFQVVLLLGVKGPLVGDLAVVELLAV